MTPFFLILILTICVIFGLALHHYVQVLESKTAALEKASFFEKECQRLHQTVEHHQQQAFEMRRQNACLETQNNLLEEQLKTQKETFSDLKKQAQFEFEHLSHLIFQSHTKTFQSQSEKTFQQVLQPLQEKIKGFEHQVRETYVQEAKERHALKNEIERLMNLNETITQEARSLTQALRGDSKIQGHWGELILEHVLEASGLIENREFFKQKSYENDQGQRLRPDIIIQLPQHKHLILDAKVSLTAYDRYCHSSDDTTQKQALQQHLQSIEKHAEQLRQKHYFQLKGLQSPEFVFLFIPIEPAYLLALQADPQLFSRIWKKGIALVTATTLIANLKTVASLWKLESQNKNALAIAQEGAKLYDKFIGFLEDFEKIEKSLNIAKNHYELAFNKLKAGPGNLCRRIENLKILGIQPQQTMPASFREEQNIDEDSRPSVSERSS